MSKSQKIRDLAKSGMETADIAREGGVRYQHANNVLKRSNGSDATPRRSTVSPKVKPDLTVDMLTKAGFQHSGTWLLADGLLAVDRDLPKDVGVYAFAKAGAVMYVGLATMGLSKRLTFIESPEKPSAQASVSTSLCAVNF